MNHYWFVFFTRAFFVPFRSFSEGGYARNSMKEQFSYFSKKLEQGSYVTVFGTARTVIGDVESLPSPKTAKKCVKLLTAFTQNGVLSGDLSIGMSSLQYTTSGIGDPGYTFVHMEDESKKGWYIHPKVLLVNDSGLFADANLLFRQTDVASEGSQIMSGTCLFGASTVDALTEDGEVHHITDAMDVEKVTSVIKEVSVLNTLHQYEAETLLRLTHFFNYVGPAADLSVYFHIPRIEYKGYGLDLYQRGFMNKDLLKEWFEKVNSRAQAISHLYEKRMPEGASYKPVAPLAFIEEMLLETTDMSQEQAMTAMSNKLAENSKIWCFVLSSVGVPRNPVELNYLSYIVAYLELAQNGKPTVVIENPNEVKIWNTMKNTIKDGFNSWKVLGNTPMKFIGVYIHPNVNIPENGGLHGTSYMLYSSVKPGLDSLKEVVLYSKKLAPSKNR